MTIVKMACPRCESINLRHADSGPGFEELECTWCGKLFVRSDAKLKEFEGEKKVRQKKIEQPWMFPELKK